MLFIKRFKQKAFLSLILFGYFFPISSHSLSTALNDSHSLEQQADGSYKIIGDDAYFSLALQKQTQASDLIVENQSLKLNISIERAIPSDLPISAELFFKQVDSEQAIRFNPDYRVQFLFIEENVTELNVPLPNTVKLTPDQLVRLDINNCLDCVIKINSNFNLTLQSNTSNVDVTRVYNGRLYLEGENQNIYDHNWLLNDLETIDTSLIINGKDPYLISPILDFDTKNLAGVLIAINAPLLDQKIYDIQLFYATDRHRFVERASSFIRFSGSTTNNINAENIDLLSSIEFFVPLEFLSKQTPSSTLLKRLRLDLPLTTIDSDTLTKQQWSIEKIELVSLEQYSKYQHLIPQHLTHKKLFRTPKRQIVINIVNKLFNDLAFIIIYILILLLVTYISLRKFKNSKNP